MRLHRIAVVPFAGVDASAFVSPPQPSRRHFCPALVPCRRRFASYSASNSWVGFDSCDASSGNQSRRIKMPSSIAGSLFASIDGSSSDTAHESPIGKKTFTVEDSKLPLSEASEGIQFPGKHKWLGGAVDDDGRIYGIPSHSRNVICLSPPTTEERERKISYQVRTIPLPPSVAKGKFKWLRGIICDGYLYGIPAWSFSGVLKVDIARLWGKRGSENVDSEDDIVKILPLPSASPSDQDESDIASQGPTRWLWHGAALNDNSTAIYCIPSNAHSVLKIDLATSKTSLLHIPPSSTPLTETNKWYGGIRGRDGAIYGVPYAASGVLRIDANTDTVTILGDYGVREYNWHGGILSQQNGAIYAFPAHSPYVLKIDTTKAAQDTGDRLSLLPIHRAPYDDDKVTRYKWLGGSVGADNAIYGMPSDASSILRIDAEADVATTFGTVSTEKNKYQGGVLLNGFLYAIPSNALNVLKIDTTPDECNKQSDEVCFMDPSRVSFVGDFDSTKDKWQGGFVGIDNSIYAIPENFNLILKITSASSGEVSVTTL